jgi:AraC family transcriptional regulator, ethanolamine operon transcriptional activator
MTFKRDIGFDEYLDSIQVASVSYLKTGPTQGPWNLSWHALDRIALQFGKDGSARIVHGLTRPGVSTIFIQTSNLEDAVFLDGHPGRLHDIAIFPPATHFTFVSEHQLQWLAISVPVESNGSRCIPAEFQDAEHLLNRKALVSLPPSTAKNFVEAGERLGKIALNAVNDPGITDIANAESEFLRFIANAMTQRLETITLPSEFNESAERIIFRALEYVRAKTWEPISVEDLVAATGTEYRTLLRAFQRYLNMGPKHYLKLRQLNLVRIALRQKRAGAQNVTSILGEHGVTEFGRFAIEYRQLFGEAPSETLGAVT